MALDGIYLHLLTRELNDSLRGAKVERLYQTQKTELVLTMRTMQGRFRLLISASGNAPGIRITTAEIDNPDKPPMLCMLLRKHLVGGRLENISQVGCDRILRLEFTVVNELGDTVTRYLIVEIMARHSNIILLDENDTIIDSVKRVDLTTSSVRQVLPGMKYVLPPRPGKLDPSEEDADALLERVLTGIGTVNKALLSGIEGLSPLTANEIACRAGCSDTPVSDLTDDKKRRLLFELEQLCQRVTGFVYTPCLVRENGRLKDFSYMSVTCFGSAVELESRESLSALADEFYSERDRYTRMHSRAEDMFRNVTNMLERASRRLDNRRLELERCAEADDKRMLAELINSNLYKLKKGDETYECENWYDDGRTVEIPVKPELTPAENAARYFKEYRKLKTASERLKELIEDDGRDIEYLSTVLDELSRAESDAELSAIRRELYEGGYVKSMPGGKNQKKNAPKKYAFRELTSPGGYRVLVGRNNNENDALSFKTASKNDVWFHAQKMPGSHVVLFTGGADAPDEDMAFAARTAAWYSSGRDSGSVEVDYTPVRELKKPAGSRPGFVIYHKYNSVSVRPTRPDAVKED